MKSVLLVLVSLVLVAVLGIASGSLAQINLLANPGFEAGGGSYDGWFTFGSGPYISTAETDGIMRSGVAAAKIFGEFTGCPDPHGLNVGGFGQAFTPTIGKLYEFSGYSYISSSDPIPGTDTCNRNRCIAKIVFWDADSAGYEISANEIVIGDGNMPQDEWVYFSISAPAPPGAKRVEALILFLQPGCDSGSVFIDDLTFYELPIISEPNILVNPSFDGDLSGWNIFGNVYYDARYWAVRTPPGAAKMFSTFVPGYDSGMYQRFPAKPDTSYKLEVYTLNTCWETPLTPGNDNFVLAEIAFRDSADTVFATAETVVADSSSPLGTWTKHSLIATAPAGTESLDVYLLFISPSQIGGAIWVDDVLFRPLPPAGVKDGHNCLVRLHQNSPNPFNSATRIRFDVAEPSRVVVNVYDVRGKLVKTLVDSYLSEGRHELTWDATDAKGHAVTDGIYFYQLVTKHAVQTKKMVLIQ